MKGPASSWCQVQMSSWGITEYRKPSSTSCYPGTHKIRIHQSEILLKNIPILSWLAFFSDFPLCNKEKQYPYWAPVFLSVQPNFSICLVYTHTLQCTYFTVYAYPTPSTHRQESRYFKTTRKLQKSSSLQAVLAKYQILGGFAS